MNDLAHADLVLLNGRIMTVDLRGTVAEVVAVKRSRIMKVGSDGEIEGLIGRETRSVNLEGRAVLPGFIDSHVQQPAPACSR